MYLVALNACNVLNLAKYVLNRFILLMTFLFVNYVVVIHIDNAGNISVIAVKKEKNISDHISIIFSFHEIKVFIKINR